METLSLNLLINFISECLLWFFLNWWKFIENKKLVDTVVKSLLGFIGKNSLLRKFV